MYKWEEKITNWVLDHALLFGIILLLSAVIIAILGGLN